MKNAILLLLILFAVVSIAAAGTTFSPSKDNNTLKRAEFVSAYFNLMSFAKSEMKVDFSADSCFRCGVLVIEARDVPKFVDLDRTGFDGEELKAVQRVIATNRRRAVVLENVPDARTQEIKNLVFLPMDKKRFVRCPEATNGAFLANAPQAGCGIRTFGFKGTGTHCGVCAIGFCCGTCVCKSCKSFTIERPGLDLPDRFNRLFDTSGKLADFPVNVNLVK